MESNLGIHHFMLYRLLKIEAPDTAKAGASQTPLRPLGILVLAADTHAGFIAVQLGF